MNGNIKIACLPVAGIGNPYQHLMIKGLNESELINAFNGVDDRFLGPIRTWYKYKPKFIHFDWIHSYYIRRTSWMTYFLLPLFILQVVFLNKMTSSKIVWTLHNLMPHNSTNLFVNKFVRRFFANQCLWIRVFSENTIDEASKLLKVSKHKIKVIPEGDYRLFYPNTISRAAARSFFKLRKEEKVFLYLGFIRPYKGIENLIYSFLKLKEENIKLIIVGQNRDKKYVDSLKKNIKANATNKIIFKDNFIPNDDLQIYYNACDIVVLPFEKVENSGSVILAMGFKKPIIAPDLGVLNKRLQNQKKILYTDNLYGKLNEIIRFSNKELSEIGNLNFNFLDSFSWKDFSNEFIKHEE
jgi:beta-1,4-mannosyltransferase